MTISEGCLEPTADEIKEWLLQTIRHAYHVEYYLHELQIGGSDPERPHDIVGENSKFDWPVLRGFSVQHRDRSKEYFERQVMPSLILHRCQYHHRKWNEYCPSAVDSDMKLGAVDAICSLLEPRDYQGGHHDFEGIAGISIKNPVHKRPWMYLLLDEMRKLSRVRLHGIVSLDDIPNIGVPRHVHESIREHIAETRQMIVARGYAI